MEIVLPETLQAYAARGPEWAAWLDRLPRLVRELLEEWSLAPDGEATHGHTALVLPVRTTAGRSAALKVGWPHPEAEHEALALQHWHGRGAVPLLKADPHRWALLLDRIGPEDLGEHWTSTPVRSSRGSTGSCTCRRHRSCDGSPSWPAAGWRGSARCPRTPRCHGGWWSTPGRWRRTSLPTTTPTGH